MLAKLIRMMPQFSIIYYVLLSDVKVLGGVSLFMSLLQSVQFSAAVIVTTPQKLAFVDVAKGIRMFARMAVPCVAVAENMSFFDGEDGKR